MPRPQKGETRAQFVARAVPQIVKEGHTPRQAVGKAEGMFDYYSKKRKG